MSLDKLVDSTQLDSDLTSVANAIRAKSGGSGQLAFPAGFVSEINGISAGGYKTGTVTPTSRVYKLVIDTGIPDVHGILVMPESESIYSGGGRNTYLSVSNFLTNGRIKACICYSNSSGTASEKFTMYTQADSMNYSTKSGSVVTVGSDSITNHGQYIAIPWRWYAW